MTPNIFISSTIEDLHYLRDGLRDAIEELCYRPVMSEHGEVGYISPTTAAQSCYRSVGDCQMIVMIVGKRYGAVGDDSLSITHKEFRAARDKQIPMITFVEPEINHYKKVFDADQTAPIWDSDSVIENPRHTFRFLNEINESEAYNAIIPFTSVGDAKRKLKLQIADFFWQHLSGAIQPVAQQMRDVLAEIKTIRNQLTHGSERLQSREKDTQQFLVVTRFLLNENAAEYRKFLEHVFGNLDAAIIILADCPDFSSVLEKASYRHEVVPEDSFRQYFHFPGQPPKDASSGEHVVCGSFGERGGYVVYSNKFVRISQSFVDLINGLQKTLIAKAKVI